MSWLLAAILCLVPLVPPCGCPDEAPTGQCIEDHVSAVDERDWDDE